MRALAILMLLAPMASSSAQGAEPPHPLVTGTPLVIANDRQTAEGGLHILQAGGSAADAAVAMLMVTSVVDPQDAGVGGGATLVRFDAATQTVTAWDGRETAPAAAMPNRPPDALRAGARAIGTPGVVPMLEALHREKGRLPWAVLIAPAIHLAEQGAIVSPALAAAIASQQDTLRRQPELASVFFGADGAPLASGAVMTNPALVQTLQAIATAGAAGLLRGPIAAEIATATRADDKGGLLTTDDLATYLPRRREAACSPYRWARICTTPPPAGGLMLLQILGLLDHTDFAAQEPGSLDAASLLIEAGQLALADTARYLADPDFVAVPVAGLLADQYLAARARLIDRLHAIHPGPGHPIGAAAGTVIAGNSSAQIVAAGTASAGGADAGSPGAGAAAGASVGGGTSDTRAANAEAFSAGSPGVGVNSAGIATAQNTNIHTAAIGPGIAGPTEFKPAQDQGASSVAIVDAEGNAIAMTATLGGLFGSKLFVHGFPLNAALADFATPGADATTANRIQPGKRPATTVAPAIVLDGDRRLVAIIGSTSGPFIPAYEAHTLAGLLAWHMEPAAAVALPHLAAGPMVTTLEEDTAAADLALGLLARGHAVTISPMSSATVLMSVTQNGLTGAADPRSPGVVAGGK